MIRRSSLDSKHETLQATFADEAGWRVPDVYTSPVEEVEAVRGGVGVADVSAAGKLLVKGEVAADLLTVALSSTPESLGGVTPVVLKDEADLPVGGGYVAQIAQDEFLIVTPAGVEKRVAQRLEQRRIAHEIFVSVIDQTSGLAGLLVAGQQSRDLLSKLCALPFQPSEFPNHHVTQTSVAKVQAIIVRNDRGEAAAFELYVERPYGEYMWESILDAGQEFGIALFGQQARALLDQSSERAAKTKA